MRKDLIPGPAPSGGAAVSPAATTPSAPVKDAAKEPATPGDRATTFQAVEGGEQHSGAVLLVEAYAAIWLFLLGFVLLQWVKQAKLHARLDELERVVDRAADKLEKASLQGKAVSRATDDSSESQGATGPSPKEA